MSFFVFSKMAAAVILNFQKVNFGHMKTLVLPVSTSTPNSVQLGQEFWAFFKMAAAAILNLQKVLFLTPDDTYVAHIYHRIRFGAN